MKKYFYLLMAAAGICFSAKAAPGDTTWVYANNVKLTGYGNYDSSITFPSTGKTYRSIYMIFTLGKYMCAGYNPALPGTGAGETGWCGDWDYTVQNYLITPRGQTFELGRFITPYANALSPRTPWTATQTYVYDITDYAPVLHDSALMRIAFSGYSGGFTGNIVFMFIEGTPDRDVTGLNRVWGGSFGYGDTSGHGANWIDVHFPTVNNIAPEFTQSATLKFTVTGHGSDGNGCCEFMSHNYQVLLNGSTIANTAIWRNTCGINELYPQSGTWLYDRGNWCPGAIVYSNFHNLPGITAGTEYSLGLTFDPYVGGGSYTTEATLFYYGGMKKTLDASIDQIISPTNDGNYFRENPICGSPVIHIKNRGSATINSVTFQYGISDTATKTYTWTGTLSTFEETDVTLPPLSQLNNIAGDTTIDFKFTAKIISVNNSPDADPTNNSMTSYFMAAPLWPSSFKVLFYTNNEAITANPAICETSWLIYDMNNNIVAQRTNADISKLYTDTIKLGTGYYRLQIYDSSCDGLQWWVNAASGNGITAGYINVENLKRVLIPMKGYNYSGSYNNDFGCGFTQYFYTIDTSEGVSNISESSLAIEAYPNPAQNMVNVNITGLQQVSGRLQVIDALGRVVSEMACNDAHQQINVGDLVSGVYTILFINNDGTGNRLTTRLLIAK